MQEQVTIQNIYLN